MSAPITLTAVARVTRHAVRAADGRVVAVMLLLV
jgi:hypothetical protein